MRLEVHEERGLRVVREPQPDTELIWLDVVFAGGGSADPIGCEGLHRHAALLAARGAGARPREQFDRAVDQLGASIDISVNQDLTTVSLTVLRRHALAAVDLFADILAAPRFDLVEHERLLRETPQLLEEIRDDDASLAARWFDHLVAPGYLYGRSTLGNVASFARLTLPAARDAWVRRCVKGNAIVGLAGGFSPQEGAQLVARLAQALPDGTRPTPASAVYAQPQAPRAVLVDKPERTQAQLRIGHVLPRWGDADTAARTVLEAAFGGMFSSRLMQEIRVKRGWSYGAGCAMRRSRHPHWFEIALACDLEVAAAAVELAHSMFHDLVAKGLTADELGFSQRYLEGAMPFQYATARQRVQLAVRNLHFDLPANFSQQLREQVATISGEDIRRALAAFYPDRALTLVVATAAQASAELTKHLPGLEVVPFDSY